MKVSEADVAEMKRRGWVTYTWETARRLAREPVCRFCERANCRPRLEGKDFPNEQKRGIPLPELEVDMSRKCTECGSTILHLGDKPFEHPIITDAERVERERRVTPIPREEFDYFVKAVQSDMRAMHRRISILERADTNKGIRLTERERDELVEILTRYR